MPAKCSMRSRRNGMKMSLLERIDFKLNFANRALVGDLLYWFVFAGLSPAYHYLLCQWIRHDRTIEENLSLRQGGKVYFAYNRTYVWTMFFRDAYLNHGSVREGTP